MSNKKKYTSKEWNDKMTQGDIVLTTIIGARYKGAAGNITTITAFRKIRRELSDAEGIYQVYKEGNDHIKYLVDEAHTTNLTELKDICEDLVDILENYTEK